MRDPGAKEQARLVCRCVGVSSTRILGALAAGTPAGIEPVGRDTGAGTVCGSCHPEIEELIALHLGRPWPEQRVRHNRRACHAASLQRVEAVLFQMIAPRLKPACEVELISLDGLCVELHLRGADSPALRDAIGERLRKLVCTDIAVRFS
jgi:NifU-like protein